MLSRNKRDAATVAPTSGIVGCEAFFAARRDEHEGRRSRMLRIMQRTKEKVENNNQKNKWKSTDL